MNLNLNSMYQRGFVFIVIGFSFKNSQLIVDNFLTIMLCYILVQKLPKTKNCRKPIDRYACSIPKILKRIRLNNELR